MQLWFMTRYDFRRLVHRLPECKEQVSVAADSALDCLDSSSEQALLLTDGHIKVLRYGQTPKPLVVEVINPGEIVGTIDKSEVSHPECAVSLDSCLGIRFDRARLEELALASDLPPCELWLRRGWRTVHVTNPVAPMLFRSLNVRLADLLVRLGDRGLLPLAKHGGSVCTAANWQMADLVNTNRELVRLTLEVWEQAGWVERGFRGYRILQLDALRRLASSPQPDRHSV